MHFLVLLSALVVCAAGVPFNTIKPTQDESAVPLNTKTLIQDKRSFHLNTIKPTRNERLVRGWPQFIEGRPHQVALLYLGNIVCGGSIISDTCVVTAAHCVVWMNINYLTVRVGSSYHNSGGTIHYVTGGFYHGSYNQDFYQNYDVAVLRVEPPFTFGDTVQSITLHDSEVPANTYALTAGWGATWPGRSGEPHLYEEDGFTRNDTYCHEIYNGTFSRSMMCAVLDYHAPYEFLSADAGGPLIATCCPRRLVGILSWGWSFGEESWAPGWWFNTAVFTKVSAVRNWILNACSTPIVAKKITKADEIP